MNKVFKREFKNEEGEKYIFRYNFITHKCTLEGDETDWEKIPVINGYPVNFYVNREEEIELLKIWLELKLKQVELEQYNLIKYKKGD